MSELKFDGIGEEANGCGEGPKKKSTNPADDRKPLEKRTLAGFLAVGVAGIGVFGVSTYFSKQQAEALLEGIQNNTLDAAVEGSDGRRLRVNVANLPALTSMLNTSTKPHVPLYVYKRDGSFLCALTAETAKLKEVVKTGRISAEVIDQTRFPLTKLGTYCNFPDLDVRKFIQTFEGPVSQYQDAGAVKTANGPYSSVLAGGATEPLVVPGIARG